MSRGSLKVLAVVLTAAPLAAADEPICCFDGPEMFEHIGDERFRSPMTAIDAIEAVDIGAFPDRCDRGAVQRSLGGADWLITECDDGRLMISAKASSSARPEVFFLSNDGGALKPWSDPPKGKRAKAAYRQLQELNKEQIDQLVREVREVRERG